MKRNEILNTAANIINGEREQQYGKAENNFAKIAKLWGAYLGVELNAKDIAVMMILFKTARLTTGSGSLDTWIDIAGYAACGGEIATEEGADNERI